MLSKIKGFASVIAFQNINLFVCKGNEKLSFAIHGDWIYVPKFSSIDFIINIVQNPEL